MRLARALAAGLICAAAAVLAWLLALFTVARRTRGWGWMLAESLLIPAGLGFALGAYSVLRRPHHPGKRQRAKRFR